jgi:hydrogenase/urease accessory protein HupE
VSIARRGGGWAYTAAIGIAISLSALGESVAHGHPFEPPLLSLTEREGAEYDVTFRVPARIASGGLVPVLPPGTERIGPERRGREGEAMVERFRIKVPGGLGGKAIGTTGSLADADEVLLRIEAHGELVMGRITPGAGLFAVPRAPEPLQVARTYLALGVEHIVTGLDHLLFVLALVLLAPSLAAVVGTITAFTVAHSLTLALAALDWVALPSPPIEASIALSIVFVARELWLRAPGAPPYRVARLWSVAFGFGLLHGLGFAGALAEIGLPQGEVPLALLTFNLGVEVGQLAFVAVILLGSKLVPGRIRAPINALRVPAYAIGSVASYFFLQRLMALFA